MSIRTEGKEREGKGRKGKERKGKERQKWFQFSAELSLTNILSPGSHRPSEDTDKFVSIKTNLNQIIDQGQQRTKREGSYKDSNKPILDD